MSQSGIGPIGPYDAYKLRSPYEPKPAVFQSPDDEEFAEPDLPKDDDYFEDDEEDDLDEDLEPLDE